MDRDMVDETEIIRVPNYYKEFRCIGAECSDTCCAGWEVVIDDEAFDAYSWTTGEFGQRLRKNMYTDEEGENIFLLKEGRCPFLNKKNLCDIYTELGENMLCETCTDFPRFHEYFPGLTEVGISFSCPEAARIMLKDDEPVTFEFQVINEGTDDSDYEEIEIEDEEGYEDEDEEGYEDEVLCVECEDESEYSEASDETSDEELLDILFETRETMYAISKDRSLRIQDRILLLLDFSEKLQESINNNNTDEAWNINDSYIESLYMERLEEIRKEIGEESGMYCTKDTMKMYLLKFSELEAISNRWPQIMKETLKVMHDDITEAEYKDYHKRFDQYYKDYEYEFEKLLVYYIYRYYMKAVFDHNVFEKVQLAAIAYLVIKEIDIVAWIKNGYNFGIEDQIDMMHFYSKEVEHSEDNMQILYDEFKINSGFNYCEIINVVYEN